MKPSNVRVWLMHWWGLVIRVFECAKKDQDRLCFANLARGCPPSAVDANSERIEHLDQQDSADSGVFEGCQGKLNVQNFEEQ